MTSIPPPIVDEAESLVRRLADTLTRPRTGECLCCFIARQLTDYGCDNTQRHATRYRDVLVPRAGNLRDRLARLGAFCDCELFLNGYALRGSHDDTEYCPYGDVCSCGSAADEVPPRCAGVRRGSLQACAHWVRLRRGG